MQDRQTNTIIVTAVLVAMGCLNSPAATYARQHESLHEDLDRYESGLDFLHFWLIPWSMKWHPGLDIYDVNDHQTIHNLASKDIARTVRAVHIYEPAPATSSARMQLHLRNYEEIYESKLEPTGTPFFYTVFSYLDLGGFEYDYQVFQWASNILFLIAYFALGRIAGIRWIPLAIAGLLMFYLFRPWGLDIGVANTNRLQVFLFAVAVVLLTVPRFNFLTAGFVFGLAVAFKPNFALIPVLLFSYLLAERHFKSIAGTSLGVLAGIGVAVVWSASLFGDVSCWLDWRDYLQRVMEQPYELARGNYSLVELLGDSLKWLPWVIVGGAWGALLVRRFMSRNQPAAEDRTQTHGLVTAVALLATLMISPLVWSHYYLLSIPAMLLVVPFLQRTDAPADPPRRIAVWIYLIAVLLIAAIPVTVFRVSDPVAITLILQLGVAMLFGVCVHALWRD